MLGSVWTSDLDAVLYFWLGCCSSGDDVNKFSSAVVAIKSTGDPLEHDFCR